MLNLQQKLFLNHLNNTLPQQKFHTQLFQDIQLLQDGEMIVNLLLLVFNAINHFV